MRTLRLTLGLSVSVLSSLTQAGPLMPPPGPIAPTYKTLQDVEPRIAVNSLPGTATAVHVISEAGSYYLSDNVTGEPGKHGIEITASDVSVDLNGFAVLGQPGSLNGISGSGESNLIISRGSIRGWGGVGVSAGTVNAILQDVVAASNGAHGFSLSHNATVTRCAALGNDDGFFVDRGSVITQCEARGNADDGFFVGVGSMIQECTAVGNGDDGIRANASATVRDCVASDNVGDAIQAGLWCVIVGNQCSGSSGAAPAGVGISSSLGGGFNTITDNRVFNCTTGYAVPSWPNIIMRNTAIGCTTGYSLAPQNDAGPIGSAAASTSPWANINR